MRAEELLDCLLLLHGGNAFTADGSRRPFEHLLTGFRAKFLAEDFSAAEFSLNPPPRLNLHFGPSGY